MVEEGIKIASKIKEFDAELKKMKESRMFVVVDTS
jgi:hypothetical protein